MEIRNNKHCRMIKLNPLLTQNYMSANKLMQQPLNKLKIRRTESASTVVYFNKTTLMHIHEFFSYEISAFEFSFYYYIVERGYVWKEEMCSEYDAKIKSPAVPAKAEHF